MGRIAEETIAQIRDRVDIVDLVGRFVSLKQAGRNHKGLCPFHDEKTPSFNVRPDRGSFYCFGCHEGGDAISFLVKIENLSFPEAVRALGRQVGIEIAESDSRDRGESERLIAANAAAQSCYREALASAPNPGAAYLASRGIDADVIERFGLGFAPERWDTVVQALRAAHIAEADGAKAGLLCERSSGGHYDLLRGRVTFPIHDVRGRVIGFGGRAIGDGQEPKYLNTPESPVFHKREAFYGFPASLEPIRRKGRAVVVEGYFDLIALHRAGIEEVVATCGTALTEQHARNLRRRTHEVVVLFDGDEAGQRAAVRSLEVLLPQGLRARAAALPRGDDPDTFLAREGAEVLSKLVEEAPSALDIAIRRAVSGGCGTAWEKADAVAAVAPLIALVPSEVERAEHCNQVALAVGSEARHVEAAVRKAARGEDARDAIPVAPRRSSAEERNVLQLVRSLIEHPQQAQRVSLDDVAALVTDESLAELVRKLLEAASRGSAFDLEQVGEGLPGESRNLLRSLEAGDEIDEATATRTIDDTLRWLRNRRRREERRALTERLRDPNTDWRAVLAEKQRHRAKCETPEHPPMESQR
ncbi:MAG: DNA primase [Myxococcota bacterium]